jgi:hypothetical protein
LHGGALPNVFAVGLGSNYQPWGKMAGEPSFDGQQNSLWLYQNGLGQLIYQGVATWLERSTVTSPLGWMPAATLPRPSQLPILIGNV